MAHTTLASTDRALEKIGDFVAVQDYASLKAVGRTFAQGPGGRDRAGSCATTRSNAQRGDCERGDWFSVPVGPCESGASQSPGKPRRRRRTHAARGVGALCLRRRCPRIRQLARIVSSPPSQGHVRLLSSRRKSVSFGHVPRARGAPRHGPHARPLGAPGRPGKRLPAPDGAAARFD